MLKGCLLAPFKFIVTIFRLIIFVIVWCLKNGIKGFVVASVIVIFIGFILGKTCGGNSGTSTSSSISTTIAAIGFNIPDKITAPYYIMDGADNYYTQKYHWQGNLLILDNYWYLKDGKWVNRPADAISGTIKIITR